MGKKIDFATYGDMEGLTKLEVIDALEELIDQEGLRNRARSKIRSYAKKHNPVFCEDCEQLVIASELLVAGDRCECND